MNNFLDMALAADEPISPSTSRNWSPEQLAFFTAVQADRSNLCVQAVAGSGKTTTLVEAIRFSLGRNLFLAFNKSIAEEIKARRPSGDVKTLNALGHWQWMRNCSGAELNARKTLDLLKSIMGDSNDFKEFGYTLSRVVGLAKNQALGIGADTPRWTDDQIVFQVDEDEFLQIMDSTSSEIPSDRQKQFSYFCAKTLQLSSADLKTLDFDDQLYMPALRNWDYPSYDTVFVDECQDLSPIQHLMLNRLAAKGTRIIAVGDRHQAIYGFRGALVDSMDQLVKHFQMKEYPLSITFRCAKSIVQEANQYCTTIKAADSAPMGEVKILSSYNGDNEPNLFPDGQLVVCRNNAPLFSAILRHYRAKIPCKVLSNFLESFSGWIRSFKCEYSSELEQKVTLWFTKERDAARKKGFKGKIYGLEDKRDTVFLFCKEFDKVYEILDCLKRLGTGTTGPIFATIHKAKGLEVNSVYFMRPDLLPAFYATSEEQLQQEANLSYVAITRAKHQLIFGVTQDE